MNKYERMAALLVILVSSMAIFRFAWVPYRTNLEAGEIQARTQYAISEPSRELSSPIARENIELLDRLLESSPNNLQARVLRAANLRFLGRLDESIDEYERILEIFPTPVAMFDLGTAQMANGQDAEGFANLVKATKAQPSAGRRKVDPALENRIRVALGRPPRTEEGIRRSQIRRERMDQIRAGERQGRRSRRGDR